MKSITNIIRIFVALLFILSGLIKLNDPMGMSFKLDEYFSEGVFNLTFLQPYSLSIALFVIIVEIVLGVLLLIGYKKRLTLGSLFIMIVFFTFLTFYSAYYNKVTDCGCFGDAIKLTPWQSFGKDVILLVLILVLIAYNRYIHPIFRISFISSSVIAFTTLICCATAYYVLNHLPIIDFRAYKIGTNIQKGMEIPEGMPQPIYEINFIYKVNGVEQKFSVQDLTKLPKSAEYVSREEKLIQKGYEPPIYNFTIEKDNAEYKDEVLSHPKVLMFTAYDLTKANTEGLKSLKKLAQKAIQKEYMVIGLTASDNETIENYKQKYLLDFDFYFCDGTTIKTIERANPSIIKLEYGTITDKKHWKDIDKLTL